MLMNQTIPMIKEVNDVIIKIKKYCYGKQAQNQGNEFSPYFDEQSSGLTLRRELADVMESNMLFIKTPTLEVLSEVDGQLSLLCNFEVWKAIAEINNESDPLTYDYGILIALSERVNESFKTQLKINDRFNRI